MPCVAVLPCVGLSALPTGLCCAAGRIWLGALRVPRGTALLCAPVKGFDQRLSAAFAEKFSLTLVCCAPVCTFWLCWAAELWVLLMFTLPMLLPPALSGLGGFGPGGIVPEPGAAAPGFLRLFCALPRPALCRTLPASERTTI